MRHLYSALPDNCREFGLGDGLGLALATSLWKEGECNLLCGGIFETECVERCGGDR